MEHLNQTANTAEGTQNVAVAAVPADTRSKQEILRDSLVNFEGERIASVTKINDLFVAKLGDVELARVKRVEDLANLLIDKRYTQKAKWAGVVELRFECDVPEGTPNKAGMSKKAGRSNAAIALASSIVAKIAALNLTDEAELKKHTKADLANLLGEIKTELSA